MGVLRTRRGLGLVGFVTVMTIACVLLGLWQLDRYQLRGERNDAVRTALESEPADLSDVVPPANTLDEVPEDVEWRSVSLRGSYDDSRSVTLRLRPVLGQSGVHVLTPLLLSDGRAVLVDRGFIATASRTTTSVEVPDAPDGSVDIVGRIRLSEDGRGAALDTDSTPASVRFVDVDDLAATWDLDLVPVWVERIEQTPAEDPSLAPIPVPTLSSGPSLIYAIQWFLFGVIAVVGFVLLVRRERRVPDEVGPSEAADTAGTAGGAGAVGLSGDADAPGAVATPGPAAPQADPPPRTG